MVDSMTDALLDTRFDQARKAAELANETEPRAVSASYDEATGLVTINLKSGAIYSFPASITQMLANAPAELIAEVEVTPSGSGLHWETLDADFTVKGLLAGIFGTKAWMAELRNHQQALT